MKRSLSHCLFTAALALAFTLTFSCSSDGSSGGGRGSSKSACVSDELKVSSSTLDDIIAECRASEEYILSLLLDDDIGLCSKAGLASGKPIGEIKSDCGVEEIQLASSSSVGSVIGRSSSSNGGDPDPSSSGGNDGGNSSPSAGIVYGTPVVYGGETYNTVVIGEQTWMARNLNVMSNTGGSNCYGNDPANCAKYGRLYNRAAAMNLPYYCNSSSCYSQINTPHQGLCPEGFHVPTNVEWNTLYDYVGGSPIAGRKLKAQYGWNNCGPAGRQPQLQRWLLQRCWQQRLLELH